MSALGQKQKFAMLSEEAVYCIVDASRSIWRK